MSVTYKNYTDSRDGTVYPCVQMPDGKWWFAKNLSYASANSQVYNNDSANEAIYGRLYPWTDITDVCPPGCHIPTDAEWTALTTAIGEDVAGTKLKANSSLWFTNTGTDDYGFSVLPAGYNVGGFSGLGGSADFWSSSEYDASNAQGRGFYSSNASVNGGTGVKSFGFSLRCIVDEVSVAAPSIYPSSGTFQGVQLVTLKSSQSLPIRYTLDGSEPTISSPLYISPIPVNQDTQIKAVAFDVTIPSGTTAVSYTITNGGLQRIPNYRDHVLPYLLEQYKGDNA